MAGEEAVERGTRNGQLCRAGKLGAPTGDLPRPTAAKRRCRVAAGLNRRVAPPKTRASRRGAAEALASREGIARVAASRLGRMPCGRKDRRLKPAATFPDRFAVVQPSEPERKSIWGGV